MKIFEVLQTKNEEFTIAIDLDGVVADFASAVKDITGKHPDDLTDDEMWKAIWGHTKHVEPFFEYIPVMSDAYELVRFIDKHFKNYFFLTATGPNQKIGYQKRNWVKKVFSPMISVVTVERSKHKARYATSNTILIDDRPHSTIPWFGAGGVAILHKNTKDTINRLKNITGVDSDED